MNMFHLSILFRVLANKYTQMASSIWRWSQYNTNIIRLRVSKFLVDSEIPLQKRTCCAVVQTRTIAVQYL